MLSQLYNNLNSNKLLLILLISLYLTIAIGVEMVSESGVRSYIFSIIAALIGILISWYIGGLKVARYVSIFNLITILLFTRQLWLVDIISSYQLFIAKSFILIYLIIISIIYIFYTFKSPADVQSEKEREQTESEKDKRKNLEYMIANEKLTNDLLSEANLVKDELHIMEGNWQSALHDIVNDISSIKEKEIFEKVIRPYSDSIVTHLKGLEERLSYEIKNYSLSEIYTFIEGKITNNKKLLNSPITFNIEVNGWDDSEKQLSLDKNKLWDIIRNIINNSMTAIDLKRISRIKNRDTSQYDPAISIHFQLKPEEAAIHISDNGGGVEEGKLNKLYREPVPSQKRENKYTGQGTMLVKFFSEKMSINIDAKNIQNNHGQGLQVSLYFKPI